MDKKLILTEEKWGALSMALTERILKVKKVISSASGIYENPESEAYDRNQAIIEMYSKELEILREIREDLRKA